jgi:hypothetical protein
MGSKCQNENEERGVACAIASMLCFLIIGRGDACVSLALLRYVVAHAIDGYARVMIILSRFSVLRSKFSLYQNVSTH